MKKNIGITDRIIRFIIFDLLIGASFMGFEVPFWLGTLSFVLGISLIFTILFGYSLLYQVLGISTRDRDESKEIRNQMKST